MELAGRVCIVTGASRGLGKGIALQLAESGATVYITGRTLGPTDNPDLPGSLQETAEKIRESGGHCHAVQCDHANENDVRRLFQRVGEEQNGRLDILVNNAFAAFDLCINNIKVPFWDLPDEAYETVNNVGLKNHYLCSVLAARMMIKRESGLIVNISGHGGLVHTLNVPYGIGKEGCDRMAADCGLELKPHNVAFVSLWPGAVRTERVEALLDDPVTIAKLASEGGVAPDVVKASYEFAESTEYTGMCIVHLAKDKNLMKKSGKVHITGDLGDHYGFKDVNGQKPINIRRISSLLMFAPGWISWMRYLVPDFVKIPTWILAFAGNKLY